MEDVEEIKKRMLMQMQQEIEEEQRRQAEEQIIQNQKKILLKHILTSEARGRLERIRMAKPEEAKYIEDQLIQLYQMGRIREKIDDERFKILLKHMMPKKKDIKIRRV